MLGTFFAGVFLGVGIVVAGQYAFRSANETLDRIMNATLFNPEYGRGWCTMPQGIPPPSLPY